MKSAGFYVDSQAWDHVAQERKGFYEDNPPECFNPRAHVGRDGRLMESLAKPNNGL